MYPAWPVRTLFKNNSFSHLIKVFNPFFLLLLFRYSVRKLCLSFILWFDHSIRWSSFNINTKSIENGKGMRNRAHIEKQQIKMYYTYKKTYGFVKKKGWLLDAWPFPMTKRPFECFSLHVHQTDSYCINFFFLHSFLFCLQITTKYKISGRNLIYHFNWCSVIKMSHKHGPSHLRKIGVLITDHNNQAMLLISLLFILIFSLRTQTM